MGLPFLFRSGVGDEAYWTHVKHRPSQLLAPFPEHKRLPKTVEWTIMENWLENDAYPCVRGDEKDGEGKCKKLFTRAKIQLPVWQRPSDADSDDEVGITVVAPGASPTLNSSGLASRDTAVPGVAATAVRSETSPVAESGSAQPAALLPPPPEKSDVAITPSLVAAALKITAAHGAGGGSNQHNISVDDETNLVLEKIPSDEASADPNVQKKRRRTRAT